MAARAITVWPNGWQVDGALGMTAAITEMLVQSQVPPQPHPSHIPATPQPHPGLTPAEPQPQHITAAVSFLQ